MSAAPSIDAFLAGLEQEERPTREGEKAVSQVVREYVASVRSFLAGLHRSGASGERVIEAHSDLMDRLVRRLFDYAEETYLAEGGEVRTDLCVIAVGGYARREMNICSDVDLLFLYRDELTPFVARVAERLQHWLWDAQLTVGGATRTIAETVKLAKGDPSVRTAILGPRFLIGSGILFHEFTEAIRSDLLARPDRFIDDQIEALQARHMQFGDSLYLLQPNVKDGAGGLRDYHAAYWILQATQPSARSRRDFLYLGLLTEEELDELDAALDFLWRVRNELHVVAGRKNDQMSFELQEEIARSFGYTDGPDEAPDLPVERFMRDYYRHARAIRNYSSLAIEQCRARVRRNSWLRRIREVEGGFRIANGQLEIPHARQLREAPVGLLEAFAVAQEHDVELTRKARRLIREHLDLIDDGYRRDPANVAVFLRILDAEKRVMRSLMAMNETGLLAQFLPEWEHIVCRWQHIIYHTYTVDVHSIFLVEELRRLWRGKYESELAELTRLMRQVDDRPVLFLGCLLHDIGKGFGGNHSRKGAARARVCLERMGLDSERVERVVFLVDQHLQMSHLAQRRDLSDPKLVLDFARAVGDRTNLRNLYLLTFADIRASSATAWGDWKGHLLRELFERTSEVLETGDPKVAIELVEKRVETRRENAAAELVARGTSPSDVEAFFDIMPRRYFTAHSPAQIARHARVVLSLGSELVATAVRTMRGDFSEVIVCTPDVHGLFANIAGTLTAHDLNILGAHVYTTRSGLALEVYRVTTPPGGEDERQLVWSELDRSLRRVLSGEVQVADLLRRRGRRIGARPSPSPKPPSVEISNQESDFYTIADVAADDRLGLLHDLTRVIADAGYEVYISKAATILDQVTDTFYLKDANGQKIVDPEAVEHLRVALLRAAEDGDAADAPRAG